MELSHGRAANPPAVHRVALDDVRMLCLQAQALSRCLLAYTELPCKTNDKSTRQNKRAGPRG
jgi:hypothetical protein